MKKLRKILIPIITVTILLTTLSPFAVSAADEELSAEIETVYGGAKGIVSMTFDDGYYVSALIIDELCEKYGLEASLMLIENTYLTNASKSQWNENRVQALPLPSRQACFSRRKRSNVYANFANISS